MGIYTFMTELDRRNWHQVKDKEINGLLQDLRGINSNIYMQEQTVEVKRLFRKPVTITLYTMYIDSNYDARMINFCPPEGKSSINTSVPRQLMVTYMLGMLTGYQMKREAKP